MWRPALLVVAALAVVGAVLAGRGGDGQVRMAVGAELVFNPIGEIDANNSPSLARNPRDPENLALVHRVDRPGYSAALHTTGDGGRTWHRTELSLPDGLDRPYAPDVAFGPDGTLWVTYVNLVGLGNVPDNLWLARSSDGGRTLSPPARVVGALAFQARLAVGPDGTVHITWLQADEVGLSRLSGRPAPVVTSRTADGRRFTAPVRVSDATRELVGAATPVIDGRGDLVVLYQDFKDDRRDFENLEGPPWDSPFALVTARSEDGGRTFSPGVELESGVVPTRRFVVFLPEFPSLAAGPGAELYVAWSDGRHGDEDVFVRRSADGGRTWKPPARVNTNRRGDGTSQYLPRVAVAGGGRVDVVFLDRRGDVLDIATEATIASSFDRGRTFTNSGLSSQTFSSRIGPTSASHLPVDFGSRLGLVSGDVRSFAAWTDTRFGTEGSGRQDVVLAPFEVSRQGSARKGLAAGLAVLAAAALGGAVVRRRAERESVALKGK